MFNIVTISMPFLRRKGRNNSTVKPTSLGQLRQTLLQISPQEATFKQRGFLSTNGQTQQHLETIGKTFLQGYQTAIAFSDPSQVIVQLNGVEREYRGFAFEGAAMGFALLDRLTPWNTTRIAQFLSQDGDDHIYMTYVGIGWLLARLPGGIQGYLRKLENRQGDFESGRLQDKETRRQGEQNLSSSTPQMFNSFPHPLIGWLAIDGYGFHQGYFHWPRYIQGILPPALHHHGMSRIAGEQGDRSRERVLTFPITKIIPQICNALPPKHLSGYSCRVFDQGLGRSLWFVKGANLQAIETAIDQFQPHRRADLWSGIGLACAYAGGIENSQLEGLKQVAKPYYAQFAQGVAFAAKTRLRARNLTEHTQIAVENLCGISVQQAADLTDETLIGLSYGETVPAYEQWRQRIQNYFV